MIDLHSHVLPGIDDGVRSIDESLELLRAAHEDGIERIAATPHVRGDYPTTPREMERRLAEVCGAAREAAIPVDVLAGGELDLAFAARLDDDDLCRFGLGGNPSLLLLEFPYLGWPLQLPEIVFDLQLRGFRIVLAHPERNADVQLDPERLRPLVDGGVVVQLTAASLDGRLGGAPRAAARRLLDARLAHLVASDAHAPDVRSVGLRDAGAAAGDHALARWLTEDVPEALLAGLPLPARPESATSRFLRRQP
ncbi:MAG TPA: CpsB/CapC family capsule biosynthesis tyrosine phosphatase [Gaiellaceae bacterium]|nr:CpsB/CapC family capsule biosynthesis tyrosine phosphatase [Gaiellaceae bacterium]